MPRLIHYSDTPLLTVHSVQQEPSYVKPRGLWVSVEGSDDWKEWCMGEEFRLDHLASPHEIILAPTANILRLTNVAELDDFDEHWGVGDDSVMAAIDWVSVAQSYQGIIIAPYIWERRLELMWYYGWDCASGCIWDASAIEHIVPMMSEVRA